MALRVQELRVGRDVGGLRPAGGIAFALRSTRSVVHLRDERRRRRFSAAAWGPWDPWQRGAVRRARCERERRRAGSWYALIFCLRSSCAAPREMRRMTTPAPAPIRVITRKMCGMSGDLRFRELAADEAGDGVADRGAEEPRAHHAAHELRRRELGDVRESHRRQAQLTEGVEQIGQHQPGRADLAAARHHELRRPTSSPGIRRRAAPGPRPSSSARKDPGCARRAPPRTTRTPARTG